MHINRIEFERRPETLQTAHPGRPWLAVAMLALLVACLALAMKVPVGPQPLDYQYINAQPVGDLPTGNRSSEFPYYD